MKCPVCNSSKYKRGYCRKCGFRSDPNYLKRRKGKYNKIQ